MNNVTDYQVEITFDQRVCLKLQIDGNPTAVLANIGPAAALGIAQSLIRLAVVVAQESGQLKP